MRDLDWAFQKRVVPLGPAAPGTFQYVRGDGSPLDVAPEDATIDLDALTVSLPRKEVSPQDILRIAEQIKEMEGAREAHAEHVIQMKEARLYAEHLRDRGALTIEEWRQRKSLAPD